MILLDLFYLCFYSFYSSPASSLTSGRFLYRFHESILSSLFFSGCEDQRVEEPNLGRKSG